MSSRTSRLALWASVMVFPGAAAAQDSAADAASELDDSARSACFGINRVTDMNVLSDRHVYVQTIGSNHYLLTMARTCRNLLRSDQSAGVRIQAYGRRVCTNDGSHLIYVWFGRESVCPIANVDAVETRAEARAIADIGRIPMEVEAVPLPSEQRDADD